MPFDIFEVFCESAAYKKETVYGRLGSPQLSRPSGRTRSVLFLPFNKRTDLSEDMSNRISCFIFTLLIPV